MSTVKYSMFRTKFIGSSQLDLFHERMTPQQIMNQCIDARPEGELKSGAHWKIANVMRFKDGLGYFRIGKTRQGSKTVLDPVTGDFVEQEESVSDYSHCIFDTNIGLIAVAQNPKLGKTAGMLAVVIAELFRQSEVVLHSRVTVEIDAIPDPDEFISLLTGSYQVMGFTASFKGPNPIDADAIFQKPLSVYCGKANAKEGNATVTGDDLNREVIAEVARSSAATGNKVRARLRRDAGGRAETVSLKKKPVVVAFESAAHQPESAATEIQSAYQRIRNSEDATHRRR